MLPHLPSVNGDLAGAPVRVPPHPSFRAVLEPIKTSRFGSYKLEPNHGETAAQRAGLRYEKKVHAALQVEWGERYHQEQLILFEDGRGTGVAVPDGMLFLLSIPRVVIFEIKAQHVPESWWQLRRKYQPLVRKALGEDTEILLVEICRLFDKDTPYPEGFKLLEDTIDLWAWVLAAKTNSLGVLPWKM